MDMETAVIQRQGDQVEASPPEARGGSPPPPVSLSVVIDHVAPLDDQDKISRDLGSLDCPGPGLVASAGPSVTDTGQRVVMSREAWRTVV